MKAYWRHIVRWLRAHPFRRWRKRSTHDDPEKELLVL